ncbi:hypothetical protein GGI20_000142 [Coemansia sp. BCRC 34301]|nr:hypothetical protein GGI20_000142 [Coemansia sp. BCRC 34301]
MGGQPQCSTCIRRASGITCHFVNVRYITELRIGMEGADDGRWIEFYAMCMTVSSIKSVIRYELAVVRDVQAGSTTGHAGTGAIMFHDTPLKPEEGSGRTTAVHPLFGCASTPCTIRNIPSGSYQKRDECQLQIFSTFFSCSQCMRNLCSQCFVDWNDVGVTSRLQPIVKGGRAQDISSCKQHTFVESGMAATYRSYHKKSQFIRVSYYTECELELMMRKANRIVRYCDHLDETQPVGYNSMSLCANAFGA